MNITTGNYLGDAGTVTTAAYTYRLVAGTDDPTNTAVYVTNTPYQYVDSIGYSKVGEYKRRAFRLPKKKRGDLSGKNAPDERIRVLNPVIIFEFAKKKFSFIQAATLSKRLEMVCKLLESAKVSGQTALTEKIEKEFGPLLREQELIACGITQFISSKLLEEFVNASVPKIIKITPIKNYIRPIPKSVLKVKEKADNKKLFDDYVVVHTDPNDKAVEKTEAEKKDPILFGIIRGSERFYFVADWVDELCDLTFDDMLKKFKEFGPEMSLLGGDLGHRMREILED